MLKERIRDQVAQQSILSLTTDIWISRAGDGYIFSLTAHYITDNFELCHQNLSTCRFPWTHNHLNIAEILQKLADTWHIDLDDQVSVSILTMGQSLSNYLGMI